MWLPRRKPLPQHLRKIGADPIASKSLLASIALGLAGVQVLFAL